MPLTQRGREMLERISQEEMPAMTIQVIKNAFGFDVWNRKKFVQRFETADEAHEFAQGLSESIRWASQE